ncbi:hypothetical protein QL285_091369 [Trifolium repens]|nr:hypothetical protein QL285_091369 [Trifolium repens]
MAQVCCVSLKLCNRNMLKQWLQDAAFKIARHRFLYSVVIKKVLHSDFYNGCNDRKFHSFLCPYRKLTFLYFSEKPRTNIMRSWNKH